MSKKTKTPEEQKKIQVQWYHWFRFVLFLMLIILIYTLFVTLNNKDNVVAILSSLLIAIDVITLGWHWIAVLSNKEKELNIELLAKSAEAKTKAELELKKALEKRDQKFSTDQKKALIQGFLSGISPETMETIIDNRFSDLQIHALISAEHDYKDIIKNNKKLLLDPKKSPMSIYNLARAIGEGFKSGNIQKLKKIDDSLLPLLVDFVSLGGDIDQKGINFDTNSNISIEELTSLIEDYKKDNKTNLFGLTWEDTLALKVDFLEQQQDNIKWIDFINSYKNKNN